MTHLTTVHLYPGTNSIPFCTGPDIPLNIIGFDWIQRVIKLPECVDLQEGTSTKPRRPNL